MPNYAALLIEKNVINMGIKIHNNLPSELRRIENFKVFKNKLKSYLLQNFLFSRGVFLVTMIDGGFVIRVSFDVILKHIQGVSGRVTTTYRAHF
jgi:hypothetical protein